MTETYSLTASKIKRQWHLIDAQDQILGRLATKVASFLIGKQKPYFAYHLDSGDYVIVINAAGIKVSGRKNRQKKYYRHSGYPGGFKEISYQEQLAKDPTKIIRHAVLGMLPKNKLRKGRLVRLKIFADANHPYQDKLESKNLEK